MKKYFVVETDEICEFGDVLNLVMFKELEDGKVTVEKEVELNENTMDWMIEMGFVEEREVEENDLIDFSDEESCEALDALEEDFEALEDKIEKLYGKLDSFIKFQEEFNQKMMALVEVMHPSYKKVKEAKEKTAQSKNK